jgi:hypothetical protein
MGRQKELAGMETASGDKELDALAEAFKRSSKKRKAAQDNEIAARSILIQALKDKKLKVYEDRSVDPPLLVTLEAVDKVKVKAIDEADDDDETDDEGDDGAKYAEMADQKATKKKPVLSEA